MGTITRSFVNGLTTNGVLGASNINNASLNNITSISGPEMTLISSATASSSASIEFSLGNYKEYQFFFVNIHPQTDTTNLTFNLSTDSGSNYNVTKTSTFMMTYHDEAGTSTTLEYHTPSDLAQSTSFQRICLAVGNGSDESASGSMHLFNPSSTTYVKHWVSDFQAYDASNFTRNDRSAGYANTTSALTNIKFQMSSGNIDAGTIYMYGIGA